MTLRRLAFSDRIGASVVAMRNSFDRGVELPDTRQEPRGSGKPLVWDDDKTPIMGVPVLPPAATPPARNR